MNDENKTETEVPDINPKEPAAATETGTVTPAATGETVTQESISSSSGCLADSSGDALLEGVDIPPEVSTTPPPVSYSTPLPHLAPTAADRTPAQGREFFRCRKGHVTEGYFARMISENEESPFVSATSGPICRVCELEWCKAKFATSPYKPPQAQ